MNKTENRILVVDDDMFTAELTGMALESAGFGIVLAEGGMDALEKISADPGIKIIVSDMNMPFINGIQLFEELRQNDFNQPFILLTGGDISDLRNRYPDIDGVLAKDEYFHENLPRLIEKLVEKYPDKEAR